MNALSGIKKPVMGGGQRLHTQQWMIQGMGDVPKAARYSS